MNTPIKIAVDAMGGESSPVKVIDGINIHSNSSSDCFYRIFGDEKLINSLIEKKNINKSKFEIIHSDNIVKDSDSALIAAKKKDTSMWKSIESLKNNGNLIMPKKYHTGNQKLLLVKKKSESYEQKELLDVKFVPLLNESTVK